jgi:hypothetical protein
VQFVVRTVGLKVDWIIISVRDVDESDLRF